MGASPESAGSSSTTESNNAIPPEVIAMAQAAASYATDSEAPSDGRSSISAQNSSETGSYLDEPPTDSPPPAYSEVYGKVELSQDGFDTRADVANDGRINININQKSRRLSNLLVPALRSQLNLQPTTEPPTSPPHQLPESLTGLPGQPPPPLNIVVSVVGSRGDVQPFVALGQVLKKQYGHRVRLATHPTFRSFVEENGLEFFSIGGDPAELMAFMVKNPGLMPGMDAFRHGDIGRRRKGMYEIFKGCWRACFEAGDGTGVAIKDDRSGNGATFEADEGCLSNPFVADAIISNPPCFVHIHCAEKLGIPLHMMFTMPWSPTQAFPHPLANIQSSNADINMTNFVSYALVEMMTWQGLGDLINRFRENTLGLEPVSLLWAPGIASRLRIPFTYCWSPALIPKPQDWGQHISIAGFYFLSLADNYQPAPELVAFLEAGPPPIYIGFGSIVVDDPEAMTKLILEAVRKTGQRALVSKGWGGFGETSLDIPEGVFMLGNVPHDWLFRRVSCVVHHGGAGTTAAGIALGKPTVVVPFFGDQPFWGAMVAKAGAGPAPIPHKLLTSDNLAKAIQEALKRTAQDRAQELGAKITSEKGTETGARSFHDALGIDNMRCTLAPSRAAVWRVKRTQIRLSAFAATVLANQGMLDFSDLKLYRPREYDTEDGPWEPISGATSALLGTMGSMMMGVADFPLEIFKALNNKSEEETKIASSAGPVLPETSGGTLDSSSLASETQSNTDASRDIATQSADRFQRSPRTSTPEESLPKPSSHRNSAICGPSPRSPSSTAGHARQLSFNTAVEAGKGVGRIVEVGLKSPMDFTLALARGFHNAPKLYGDESVRRAGKVTDFQSGLREAGKGFGYGLYDGISGLVTQPLDGAKKEGVAGFLKGFGKGIGGIVLKPGSAVFALPGYTFKGIYEELRKLHGSSVQNYIIAARTAQGYNEWRASSEPQRTEILGQWHKTQTEIAKSKNSKSTRSYSPSGFMKTRHMSFDERKKLAKEKEAQKARKKAARQAGSQTEERQSPTASLSPSSISSPNTSIQNLAATTNDADFEKAIRDSIAATSTGHVAQDQMIERAIRASVAELRLASTRIANDEAVRRAVQASLAVAGRGQDNQAQGSDLIDHEEQQKHMERILMTSLQDPDTDDSGIDTDDDMNIKRAIEESKRSTVPPNEYDDDADIQEAIRLSREHEQKMKEDNATGLSEEDTVVKYIKKQSILEEKHRQAKEAKMLEDRKSADGSSKPAKSP